LGKIARSQPTHGHGLAREGNHEYATAISPLPINAAIPDFEFDVYLELGISDDLFGIWNLGFGASAGGLGFGICLGNYFLRRIREIISSDQGQTALFQQMSPFVDIGSFEAHDQRDDSFTVFAALMILAR